MIVQAEIDAVADAIEVSGGLMIVDVNGVATPGAGQHPVPPLRVIEDAGVRRRGNDAANGERDTSPRVPVHLT
jgi:hypothetical protein